MALPEALIWCSVFLAIGIAAAGFWVGTGISELSNISVEISHED
ncbi:hypothetical protein [Bosea sp. AS-1]|nr:hypothetical protein [Bosea sp. AS-1]